ncbi:MAG: hypothetical protein P4L35_19540 [Ignavibacteriaceae bacterium]|nr:hypothetical protein [Ignavibacteriaceae bacterium]
MPKLYYSTVPYLKFFIQKTYFNDRHYVWCSECFDNNLSAPHTLGLFVPPSSNPADIYKVLKEACRKRDTHDSKIIQQRASLIKIATEKHLNGEITDIQRDEAIFMTENCEFTLWKPVIYLIPNSLNPLRIQAVPIKKRASFGPEYIIADLVQDEFDLIEV